MFTERKTTLPFSEEALFTFSAVRSVSLSTLPDIARANFPVFSLDAKTTSLANRVTNPESTPLIFNDLAIQAPTEESLPEQTTDSTLLDEAPDDPFTEGQGLPEAVIEEEWIFQSPAADSSENPDEEPASPSLAPSLAAPKNLLAPLFPPFIHTPKRNRSF